MARTFNPLLRVADFSGGLNMLDELEANDLADVYNMTLDNYGGVATRLGCNKANDPALAAALVTTMYTSDVLGGATVVQAGTGLYRLTGGAAFKTFTTSARCGMVDFAGKLVIVHPVDGTFTYDGTTLSAVAAGPKADTIAVWQNKCWTNDKSGGANPKTRLNFSAAGDVTVAWSNVDLRDVNDSQIVAVFSGQGQDIKGAPGLLAFKQNAFHRVNDSTSGAYTTVDPFLGAASALSVVGVLGRIIVVNASGIFETNGVTGLKKVSRKLDPLFTPTQLNVNRSDLVAAGAYNGRVYLSLPLVGATANGLALEYDPAIGWIVPGSNARSCYSNAGGLAFYGGSPSVNGQVYAEFASSVLDDGAVYPIRARTRWVIPNGDQRVRLNRLRVLGRGSGLTLSVYKDYTTASPVTRSLSITPGADGRAGYTSPDLLSLGMGKAFAFGIAGNPALMGNITPPIGAVYAAGGEALYALDMTVAPLGRV